MGRIVDVDGNPIELNQLTREIATPELAGVRSVWQQTVANGLTPDALVALLEASVEGDPRDYLTLAEDIEERDTHYFSVLGTRKLAVESIDVVIESHSDRADDVKLADEVRELFALDFIQESRMDLLDGLGKGYAVCEILWDRSARQWRPQALVARDQRWFQFDRLTRRELRLRDQADLLDGLRLPPFKFICHRPRLKSGLPIRNGLARIAAFTWLCKAYALKDWLAFCEVFGMPVRVGKYGANARPEDIRVLRRAVANIGADAACVIPESMKIEFIQAGNQAGGADLFERLCAYLDRQISKAVLGQTMSSDAQASGLGSANALVHNEVRGDLRDADSTQLAATYQRHLVKPYIDLNHGPQAHYPKVIIRRRKPEDVQQLANALAQLVPLGLEVEQSVVRDKLSLPDPEKGALLLRPASPAGPALNLALNRAGAVAPDASTRLADRMADEAASPHAALIEHLRREVAAASSLEDLRDRLLNAYADLPGDKLAQVMQAGFAVAELVGRYDVGASDG